MKKVLQPLFLTVLAVPSFVFAAEAASAPQTTTVDKVLAAKGPTSAQAVVKQENTTVISPRTGIRYTLGNTGNRPIILQTTAYQCSHRSARRSEIRATSRRGTPNKVNIFHTDEPSNYWCSGTRTNQKE